MRIRSLVIAGLAVMLLTLLLMPVAAQKPVGAPSSSTFAWNHRYMPVALKQGGVRCGAAPQLVSPEDGAVNLGLTPTFTVRLADANLARLGVALQVSPNASFAGAQQYWFSVSGTVTETLQPVFNLQPGTLYYWRANQACADEQLGNWSPVRTFTTITAGTTLPGPTLQSPADGSAGFGSKVTVSWNAVPGALGYQVWHKKVGGSSVVYDTVTTTSFEIWFLQPNSTYEWWVQTRNDFGYGAESAHRRFDTGFFLTADAGLGGETGR